MFEGYVSVLLLTVKSCYHALRLWLFELLYDINQRDTVATSAIYFFFALFPHKMFIIKRFVCIRSFIVKGILTMYYEQKIYNLLYIYAIT